MRTLRVTVAVVVLLMGAHLAVLLALGTTRPGPFLSNVVQLVLGLLCLAATLGARRDGVPFERRFLGLVAARFVMWVISQALGTWDSYLDSDSPYDTSLANIVFHLEELPLCIAIFLDPGPLRTRRERVPLADLLQIALFGAAVYLYCHYMPSEPDAGVARIVGAHLLVGCAFYFRAMTTRSTMSSAMFGRWTPPILLSIVNDSYSLNSDFAPMTGDLFDLVWSSELVIWAVIAASWRLTRPAEGAPAPGDRTLPLLPIIVACFTCVLGLGMLRHERRAAIAVVVLALALTILGRRQRARAAQAAALTRR